MDNTTSNIINCIASFGLGIGVSLFIAKQQNKSIKTNTPKLETIKKKPNAEYSEEIFLEQLDRTIQFYGKENFEKIRNSFIIVVGLGGVGSAVAHNLLRSGVGKLRLIDSDIVSLSSLNRNSVATLEDVGRSKAKTLKSHFEKINPNCIIEEIEGFFSSSIADSVLSGNPTYVIDCIDDTKTKIQLLKYCSDCNIAVICSFGSGGMPDCTKARINDIQDVYGCPFAKKIKLGLAKYGITKGITCVYVTDPNRVRKKLLPLSDQEYERLNKQSFVDREIRVRVLPVTMSMPTIVASLAANTALNVISGSVTHYPEDNTVPMRLFSAKRLTKALRSHEVRNYKTVPNHVDTKITKSGIEFVMDNIWNNLSINFVETATCMARWDKDKDLSLNNIVPLTNSQYKLHKPNIELDQLYDQQTIQKVNKLLSKIQIPDQINANKL